MSEGRTEFRVCIYSRNHMFDHLLIPERTLMPRHFLRRQHGSIEIRDRDRGAGNDHGSEDPQQADSLDAASPTRQQSIRAAWVAGRAAQFYTNFISSRQFQNPSDVRDQRHRQRTPSAGQANNRASPQAALYSLFGMGVSDRRPRGEIARGGEVGEDEEDGHGDALFSPIPDSTAGSPAEEVRDDDMVGQVEQESGEQVAEHDGDEDDSMGDDDDDAAAADDDGQYFSSCL